MILHSVVIPYGGIYKDLLACVRSICFQTINLRADGDVEVVIGNDTLTSCQDLYDGLNNDIPEIENLGGIKIIQNSRMRGAGNARNVAINATIGEYISFLDADDTWEANKLEEVEVLLEKGYNFVVTGYRIHKMNKEVYPPANIGSRRDLITTLGIGTSTVTVSRKLLGETRFKNLKFAQDIDLWARLAAKQNFRYGMNSKMLSNYSAQGRTKNKMVQLYYTSRVLLVQSETPIVFMCAILNYCVKGIKRFWL